MGAEAAAVCEGPLGGDSCRGAAARQLIVRLIQVHPHDVTLSHVVVQHARPLHHLAGRQIRMLPCPQRQSWKIKARYKDETLKMPVKFGEKESQAGVWRGVSNARRMIFGMSGCDDGC